MAEKRLFKEYNQLNKVPAHINNHQILSLAPLDVDNIFVWEAIICKPSKVDSPYYYNGKWKLDINVTSSYPIQPPTIKFHRHTPISHPNINIDTGEICLDILKLENWSPAWNLEHLVGAILMLLDDPEPDSPLNIDLANLFRSDLVGFESFVQFTIWRYNTLLEGVKTITGIKSSNEETYIEPQQYEGEDTPQNIEEERIEMVDDEENNVSVVETNNNIIKDVGKQVTQNFINKVDEIKHSKSDSLDSTKDYDDAKRHIVENVNKQVSELCLKSVSPSSDGEVGINEMMIDANTNANTTANTVTNIDVKVDPKVEDEKKKFLEEIDKKIHEFHENVSITGSISTTSSKNSKRLKKSKREKLKALIKNVRDD